MTQKIAKLTQELLQVTAAEKSTMTSTQFVEAVKKKAKAGKGQVFGRAKSMGTYEMATITFVNTKSTGGGGAVSANNRFMMFVDGFGKGENDPPPSGKVKLEVGASEILGNRDDNPPKRLRGKTATPEKMVDYVANYIGLLSKLKPKE